MKYIKSLPRTVIVTIIIFIVLVGIVFSLARPAVKQTSVVQFGEFGQESNPADFLATNNMEVGSETVDGYQQVYYISSDGTKKFITQGGQNSTQAVSDGEYIAYSTSVNGAGQIFLYHITTDTTKQITNSGTNLQPSVSNGKVVWEGWVVNKWQIFLYDGISVSQITTDDLSINADIEGDRIVYESNNKQGEWVTFEYTLGDKKVSAVKRGTTASRPKFRDGEIVYDLMGTFDRQQTEKRAVREATRLAGEAARIAEDSRLAEPPSFIEPSVEEPEAEPELISEEELEPLPEVVPEEPVVPVEAPLFAVLHVIKLVVNGALGTSTDSEFNLHVTSSDGDVGGSPHIGVGPPGTSYNLTPGTYTVSEDPLLSYEQIFSGDCDITGSITLLAGEEKFCTVVNTDIPPPSEEPSAEDVIRVLPVIDVVMHEAPRETPDLPDAPHQFTHNYTVRMVSGEAPLIDMSLTDDSCVPVEYLSGDTSGDGKLDLGENWQYQCSVFISETTTNTVTAVGYSDDELHEATIATAVNTIVVVEPTVPALPETGFISDLFRNRRVPRINIIKVPDILPDTLDETSGVSYKYIVSNQGQDSISDVEVLDNTCAPVTLVSGQEDKGQLLVQGDSWIYTCRTAAPVTTRNVTMVIGKANGQTAIGYAFSSILVHSFGNYNTALLVLLVLLLLSAGIYIAFIKTRTAKSTDGQPPANF